MRPRMLAAALALAASLGTLAAQGAPPGPATTDATPAATRQRATPSSTALSPAAIRSAIANAGFRDVRKLKFDDGIWKAKARDAAGGWATLRVAPDTGKVYSDATPTRLSASDVARHLSAAGYQDVHDLKFKHGVWKADARDRDGRKVEVRVDPDDGRVIAATAD